MMKRVLYIGLTAGLLATAAMAGFTLPASAEKQLVWVVIDGQLQQIEVDVPPGTDLNQIEVPGDIVPAPSQPPEQPQQEPAPTVPRETSPSAPKKGRPQRKSGSKRKAKRKRSADDVLSIPRRRVERKRRARRMVSPLRNPDGSPTAANPNFLDSGPGNLQALGVPNVVIEKFRIPHFLIPMFQAAGSEYGVRWEHLAAIMEIESNYGENLGPSSAGAIGPMQFLRSSWRAYGVDANGDGLRDPLNYLDSIFGAANYLAAAGYEDDPDRALFAYNHAQWYVDSVNLRAKVIAGIPDGLIGSLTGLTLIQFPVKGRATYADDVVEREAAAQRRRGRGAAIETTVSRPSTDIFAKTGSPAVAVTDGVIKEIGNSPRLGRYVTLRDAFGNTYRYSQLGSVSKFHPVPKQDALLPSAKALKANDRKGDSPEPRRPASAGRLLDDSDSRPRTDSDSSAGPSAPVKTRLFANPDHPQARRNGGLEQLLDAKAAEGGMVTFRNYFTRPFGLDSKDVRLRRLKEGSRVVQGTILGRIGDPEGRKASHLRFEVRPAGARPIDPFPILEGAQLLEKTRLFRANGRNVLFSDGVAGLSPGQILTLPKFQLQKLVLADPKIEVYECGRDDIASGQIDYRVLASLLFLRANKLNPTVTSLKCGHSVLTSSGNRSHHADGAAVDIAKLNDVTVLGHQEKGGITYQAVRLLCQLQGTMQPDQIISLLEVCPSTLRMGDHADHIHVGYRPTVRGGSGAGAFALKSGQWSDLVDRLRDLHDPVVLDRHSKYAIPVKKKNRRASDAHEGE